MKPWRWIIGLFLLAGTAWAVTNVVVTVTMSDEQYTNLVAIAQARGQTPEQFLITTNMGLAAELNREADASQLRLLLQLWQNATPAKRQAAIDALR